MEVSNVLLDIQASQAVVRAKLFELAVNSPGPWAIRIGDKTEWAVKCRSSVGVFFIAYFDEGAADNVAWLLHGGEEVSSRMVSVPRDNEPFSFEWRLRIDAQGDPVRV
jgi:hypothetical protein